jgi:hypothetical protein
MKHLLRALAFTGIVAVAAAAGTAQANAQVGFAVRVGPPAPVYYSSYQPACPGEGYIWNEGYYSGRIWVPGRWIHNAHYISPRRDLHEFHGDRFDHRGWDNGRRYR